MATKSEAKKSIDRAIDRRDLIKGAATLGSMAALAGLSGGATAAFASEASATSASADTTDDSWMPTWDAEADIIACGAGGAGLAAGVEACAQGLSIIICEAQAATGGNSKVCNGGIAMAGTPLQEQMGIVDSEETMYNDLCAWFKTDYDDGYVKLLCNLNCNGLYDWLTGMGIEFQESGLLQSNGHSVPREHHTNPVEVIATLEDAATTAGADLQLETRVTALVQNPITKQILGVAVEKDGQTLHYKAKKGVLLCTGGYGRNTAMLSEWNFGPSVLDMKVFNAVEGQNGDGILLGMSVGAQPRHLSYCGMLTVLNPDGKQGDECAMYHQGAIMVNLEGERFVNEGQGYTNVWSELLQQTDTVCWQIWDQPIADACADNESGYYSMKKIESTGLLITADSVEELAQKIEVPADALAATLDKYNEDCSTLGYDTVFNREHISGTGEAPFALDTPPYYAFKTTNIMSSTYGGLKRHESDHIHACDVWGNMIEGLYLAGNVSDFCNMGIIPGTRRPINASGTSFGGSMSVGRYCVQQMAQNKDWDAEA